MKTVKVSFPAGIFPIVGVMCIFLKLVGAIDWSWLWVLSPFWIPVLFVGAFFTFVVMLVGVSSLLVCLDNFLERW